MDKHHMLLVRMATMRDSANVLFSHSVGSVVFFYSLQNARKSRMHIHSYCCRAVVLFSHSIRLTTTFLSPDVLPSLSEGRALLHLVTLNPTPRPVSVVTALVESKANIGQPVEHASFGVQTKCRSV